MNRIGFWIFFKIFYYLIRFQDVLFHNGATELKVVIIFADSNVLLYLLGGNACLAFWKCNNQFLQLSGKATEIGSYEIGKHGSCFGIHIYPLTFHV